MKTRTWMLAGILGGMLALPSFGQTSTITQFQGNGKLVWTCATNTVLKYQVEWAAQAGGPWTNFARACELLDRIAPTGNTMSATVPMFYRVVAETMETASYLVFDLSAGSSATSYPVSYLTDPPAGGWTDEYKTTKLALHRIPAGIYTMGSPAFAELGRSTNEAQHQVTLTRPFYIGVFEVTQKQWERVMGDWPGYFFNAKYRDTRPVEQVSYGSIRGPAAGTNWPANGNVDADSFMGRLRVRTGKAFDLPTESQWEYAARAGTTTALNSGYGITNLYSDDHMAAVGRYLYNGGTNSSQTANLSGGTAEVGGYLPNAWGLYDCHGNVAEWCLDWDGNYPGTVSDPRGATSGVVRVFRGGGWQMNAYYCRSAHRDDGYPGLDYYYTYVGFRAAVSPGQY